MLRHAALRVVFVLIAGFGIPSLSIAYEQDKEKVAVTPVAQTSPASLPSTAVEQKPIAVDNADPEHASVPSTSATVSHEPQAVVNTVTSAAPVAENTTIQQDVTVLEFVLANQIEGREPKDIVENFKQSNGRAYAFARLSAAKNSDITFLWLRDGSVQARFTTTVHASKKWRTFSSAKLRPGHWKVQLLLGQEIVAEKAFIVE